MATADAAQVIRFMEATAQLADADRGRLVGRSANTIRRWRALAAAGEAVPMDEGPYRLLLERIDQLPPADTAGYEQGVRSALRRAREELDRLEGELLRRPNGVDPAAHPVSLGDDASDGRAAG